METINAFDYWVYVARYVNTILGAAYFATLLLTIRRYWTEMVHAERLLFVALSWLAASTTTATAFILAAATPVSPQSLLQLALTPFYVLAYRSLNHADRYRWPKVE